MNLTSRTLPNFQPTAFPQFPEQVHVFNSPSDSLIKYGLRRQSCENYDGKLMRLQSQLTSEDGTETQFPPTSFPLIQL